MFIKNIHEIIEKLDTLAIIQENHQTKTSGQNHKLCCPFHGEKTPSLIISPVKNMWKCFGCNKGGNGITFLMEEGLPFLDAVKKAAQICKLEIKYGEQSPAEKEIFDEKVKLQAIMPAVQAHFTFSEQEDTSAQKYWKSRGLDDSTIDFFGLGWCDGSKPEHVAIESLQQAGIANDKGNLSFFKRATIPIFDDKNYLVSFSARTLEKDKQPKYINGSDSAIYKKEEVLYNFNNAKTHILKTNEVWIVEGYLDVWALWQRGVYNVVAICGTQLTIKQAALLSNLLRDKKVTIYLATDADDAGTKAAIKALPRLLPLGEVKRVKLGSAKDVGESLLEHHTKPDLLKFNAEDSIAWFISQTWQEDSSIYQKTEAQDKIAEIISFITKKDIISLYLKVYATILETTMTGMWAKIDEAKSKRNDNPTKTKEGRLLIPHIKVLDHFYELQAEWDYEINKMIEKYKRRSRTDLESEYGKSYVKKIERDYKFHDFKCEPSHVNFKQFIEREYKGLKFRYYNEYKPLPNQPIEFDLPEGFINDKNDSFDIEKIPQIQNIAKFLKHLADVKGTRTKKWLNLLIDWITITYLHPQRKLQALCLVSRTEGTGKSTASDLMKWIYGDNMTDTTPDRLLGNFNSQTANKNIVCIQEVDERSDKFENLFKSLVTDSRKTVEKKNIDSTETWSFEKYVLFSNHETTFMRVGSNTSRIFILVIPTIENPDPELKNRMKEEIPYFLHFIKKRGIKYKDQNRLWFNPIDLENDALRALRESSKNIVQQEIEEGLNAFWLRNQYKEAYIKVDGNWMYDFMLRWGGRHYENKSKTYFSKVLENDFGLQKSKPSTYNTPRIATANPLVAKWEYEMHNFTARYFTIHVWMVCTPLDLADVYDVEQLTQLYDNCANIKECPKHFLTDLKELIIINTNNAKQMDKLELNLQK